MADEKLGIDITAKDSASAVVDKLQGKVDKLEKSDPTVEIDADAKQADHTVDGFADQLNKLTAADQIVVLALRAGAAQTELRDLATDLATIDRNDPDVDVKFARYGEVSGQLDDLEGKIKAIGDANPDAGAGLDAAKKKLDGLGESAGQAQGAVHSMAGNAVGDFAATASGVGPLGEALGQLTELATGGEASMKQLAVAGLGLGAISAGILVLNTVMAHFADAAKHAAEIKAFDDKQVKDYTGSVVAAQAALDKLNGVKIDDPIDRTASERMQDLASKTAELVGLWQKAGEIKAFDPVTGQIEDMLPKLAKAGITAQQWAEAVINGGVAINVLGTASRDAGLSVDTTREILQTAAAEAAKYEAAQTSAADQAKVFATVTDTATDAQRAQNAESARYQGMADQYQRETQQTIDKLRGWKTATDDVDTAYQGLQGTIDHDQSMINLRDQIDAVRQAGDEAYDAQAKADEARRTHAKDATDQQLAADAAMRTFQTSVNSLKTDIVSLGETAKISPVEVKSDLDAIERGDLDQVAADAEAYYRRNPIDAATRLKLISTIVSGVGGVVPLTTSTAAAGPTTVNNFLARPAAAVESARVAGRRARINGR